MSAKATVRHDWLALGLIAALVAIVMLIGNLATMPQIPGWYASLNKPSWTPPNWVFGPVWGALYLMMALAAWLVWRRRHAADVRPALAAWVAQLALNLAWSLLFFGAQAITAALIEIAVLWLAILTTTVLFWRTRPLAGALLLPYLAWVGYALSLNAGIVALN